MPEVVQTGASVAIDFLSGFGKGMVQAEVNKRENEKLNIQKSKWKAEMSAMSAQDELRRMQLKNTQLEIDMRKTQFADIKATREQTEGFTALMADAIGKAKGNPAEKQAQLLEAYAQGAAEFTMADMSIGDKLIDAYAKISDKKRTKLKEIIEVKNLELGTKQKVMVDEYGDQMGVIPGTENLEVVNDTIKRAEQLYQDKIDQAFQAFFQGRTAFLGADGQSLNLDDFMQKVTEDDDRTKTDRSIDYIFDVTDSVYADAHEKTGTLDQMMGRMLKSAGLNDEAIDKIVSPYAEKTKYMKRVVKLIDRVPLEERAELFAQLANDVETLVPAHERDDMLLELTRQQNKTALAMRDREVKDEREDEQAMAKERDDQLLIAEQVAKSNRQKEKDLLKKFVGYDVPPEMPARNWWDTFLGKGSAETFPEEAEREQAYDTLRGMQEAGLAK